MILTTVRGVGVNMTDNNSLEDIYGGSSNFLKTTDVQKGQIMEVEVKSVTVQTIGDNKKLVVELVDKAKSFVLNKTNATQLANNLGSPDYNTWAGKKFKIFRTVTQYQGGTVECLRVV